MDVTLVGILGIVALLVVMFVWGMPVRPRTYQFSLQYNWVN